MYLSDMQPAMKPSDAYACLAHREIERVEIDHLEGRVTTILLTPYPPGTPLLIPGERFNKTILQEFYQVALRRKLYRSMTDLQADLDAWMREYNTVRTHQGRWCYGKTPMQTFIDMLPVAREKLLQAA